MTSIVLICIWIIIAAGAYIVRGSKSTGILLLLFMFVVYTFCSGGNPDLANYQFRYDTCTYGMSIGFDLMMEICNTLNLTFTQFKCICGLLCMLTLYCTVRKCTRYAGMVIALYSLFPFISSVAQLRNGLMAVIVTYAIVWFIKDQRHRVWPYIIGILIAATIHPTALFYLILLLAKVDFEKYSKLFIASIIMITFTIVIVINYNLIYNLALELIHNPKYIHYFDYETILEQTTKEVYNWKGKLVVISGPCIGYFVFNAIYRRYKTEILLNTINDSIHNHDNDTHFFNIKQLEMINRMQMILFVLFPFYLFNPTYFRLYKNLVLMVYIVAVQYLEYTIKTDVSIDVAKKWNYILIICAFLATWVTASGQGFVIEMLDSFSLFWR